MAKPKPKVKIYPVLAEAVETGVAYGLNRAYKHTDTPTRETMAEVITTAVLHELCERLEVD